MPPEGRSTFRPAEEDRICTALPTVEPAKESKGSARTRIAIPLLVLASLALCQVLWFGPILTKIGFYLDDWLTYTNLYFSKQGFNNLLATSLSDPRVIVRPADSVYMVLCYMIFGAKPLGHHVLNCVMEVASSWLLYLSLVRMSGNRTLAFLAAIILLVYPAHDSTHYWTVANTITLGLLLWLSSLWMTLKAVQDSSGVRQGLWSVASAGMFLLSLLIYEAFLPLAAINVLCTAVFGLKRYSRPVAAMQTMFVGSLYATMVGAVYWYQRIYLAGGGKGLQHPASFEIGHFTDIIVSGLRTCLSPETFSYFFYQATQAEMSISKWLMLFGLLAVSGGMLVFLSRGERKFFHPYALLLTGFLTILFSYTIFGITTEYQPALNSIYSRINYGGCVGVSLLFAGICGAVMQLFSSPKTRTIALLCLAMPLLALSVTADWGFSTPWRASWAFQREVVHKLKAKASELQSGDTVLLARTPRYVMSSPCFDGVWDFQYALRMATKDGSMSGGVLSDRLTLTPEAINDITVGYVAASYPYRRLFIFVPLKDELVRINGPEDFLAFMRDQTDWVEYKRTLPRWEKELASMGR